MLNENQEKIKVTGKYIYEMWIRSAEKDSDGFTRIMMNSSAVVVLLLQCVATATGQTADYGAETIASREMVRSSFAFVTSKESRWKKK